MKSARDAIRQLAHAMDEEDNAASDLWTWLPSYDEANNHHGDYASEFRPDLATLIREAAVYLSALRISPEAKATAIAGENERSDWFACPCGEFHGEG